jgi:hypothetical protein
MDAGSIDLAALAKLRPGMPVSALSSALGNHWVPLRNENAGYFWGRILNIPLNVRVDVNGVIGQSGLKADFRRGWRSRSCVWGWRCRRRRRPSPGFA